MALKVYDLTMALEDGLKIYPDSVPFKLTPVSTIVREGYNVNRVEMDEHSGTHVDAPRHFYENGLSIDRVPVDMLIGRAVIMDFSSIGSRLVGIDDVLEVLRDLHVSPGRGWYLFLKLRGPGGFRLVSEDVAKYIVERGLYGLGVDTPSPDDYPYPVHRVLLGSNRLIIENLVIPAELRNKLVDVIVAPLKIRHGTGAPARVLVVERG
ncbi:MAG: cyclase family protein [Desulfurococcales archaeon]|nr:cyclase family protein [Desulfurococcales archaeon]